MALYRRAAAPDGIGCSYSLKALLRVRAGSPKAPLRVRADKKAGLEASLYRPDAAVECSLLRGSDPEHDPVPRLMAFTPAPALGCRLAPVRYTLASTALRCSWSLRQSPVEGGRDAILAPREPRRGDAPRLVQDGATDTRDARMGLGPRDEARAWEGGLGGVLRLAMGGCGSRPVSLEGEV